ncbi:hypothetical protein DPMN_046192 [Dreissena polymorpha]|uniref:Uncharacterized protein n=1 Tax=Dreissena polymorpha TaxID=45954 RepID=A0A9D4I0B6_DREPO|nr:hypothetical protein DPMN_046192 [Dreissena polymorpha]
MSPRVLTRFYNIHIIQRTGSIFVHNRAIIEKNIMTKFHENWTINVTSRVLSCKSVPHPGGHVFQRTRNHFRIQPRYHKTSILTKFHEDWSNNKTSRVLTNFYFNNVRKTAPPPVDHDKVLTKFHEDWIINVTSRVFELDQDIIWTNLLTNFHKDQTINVASRVLTRKNVNDGRR